MPKIERKFGNGYRAECDDLKRITVYHIIAGTNKETYWEFNIRGDSLEYKLKGKYEPSELVLRAVVECHPDIQAMAYETFRSVKYPDVASLLGDS